MSVTWEGKTYSSWVEVRALEAVKQAAPVAPPVAVAMAEAPPVFGLSSAPSSPAPVRKRALTEVYRPRKLSELVGQEEAVAVLSAFVADPYPAAFIMSGETGVGKSSAAIALACELGCDVEQGEWGGFHAIESGEMNADTLRGRWDRLYGTPMGSARGWKTLVCNEIEQLTGTVEKLWLDKLENIPDHTVVVFTTNSLASLPARFVDRCIGGVLEFRGAADDLAEPARGLARSIWRAETGGEIPSDVLEKVIQRATSAGRLSLRRVVQHLTPLLAKGSVR